MPISGCTSATWNEIVNCTWHWKAKMFRFTEMISRNKKEYHDLYLEVPDRGDDSSVAQVLFVLLAIRDHLLLLHLLQVHLGKHKHEIFYLMDFK